MNMGGNTEERWQRNITSIRQGIGYIFDTKEFADVDFIVRGHRFKAHRLVLAARSSEFARILLSANAADEIIVDKGSPVTKNGFEILLRFMYKDILGTTDKRLIVEGYLSAKYYKQKIMQTKCEEAIESWIIDTDEVCDLLNVGSDILALKDKCISFIRNNAIAVISSDSFKSANFKSLRTIMESGVLENVPILQRIEHIMKWGASHQTSQVNYSLVRKQLLEESLLGKLEFEKLNLEDLPHVLQKYPGLIADEEVTKFLLYYSTKAAKVLPAWCSS